MRVPEKLKSPPTAAVPEQALPRNAFSRDLLKENLVVLTGTAA